MKPTKFIFSGMLVIALLMAIIGCQNNDPIYEEVQPVPEDSYVVSVAELADSSEKQPRWLSIPDSRLVINYYDYATYQYGNFNNPSESEFSNSAVTPLNVGYLDPYRAIQLPEQVLILSEQPSGNMEADCYSTSWRADRLDFTAGYGEHEYSGYDYFYDEDTIVRNIENENGTLCITGPYSGTVSVIDGVIISRNTSQLTAVAVKDASYTYYGSYNDMVDNYNPSDEPTSSNGWWKCSVSAAETTIAFAVKDVDTSEEEIARAVLAPLQYRNAYVQAQNREAQWNQLFSRVPRPTNFSFDSDFDAMGITSEDIELKYYQAWALIISNVLPESPETNFPYKQVANGKASLWHEGADASMYSAQWESLYGIGFLSYVLPEDAWSACLGFMSMVGEDGLIGGETLPTNKAQTVWMCYSALSNKEYLQQCVEPLERYLTWALDNPRWILGTHNYPNERDMDYCSNILVDITFLQKIYTELGNTAKAEEWGSIADEYYTEKICKWFFPENMNEPVEFYYTDSGAYKIGSHLRILKILNSSQIDGEYLQKTITLAKRFYDPTKRFMGYDYVKYDEMQYTIYGFIRQGETEMAANCIQATLRDVTEAGMLGEEYRGAMTKDAEGNDYESVFCQGVRPSMFGAELIIDNVWLLNGYYYHEGGINAISLFEGNGGLQGIVLNNQTYNVSVSNNTVQVNGNDYDLEYGKVFSVDISFS